MVYDPRDRAYLQLVKVATNGRVQAMASYFGPLHDAAFLGSSLLTSATLKPRGKQDQKFVDFTLHLYTLERIFLVFHMHLVHYTAISFISESDS